MEFKELNGYDLSRAWFDFCFENPELINPNHSAIYFFAIEHCNRLGWKKKFGFPTQMAMDAIGIRKHSTYIKYFNNLCNWGFFKLIQKSTNQYSANIICLQNALPKNGKALGKAIVIHAAKQTESMGQSNNESNSSIDKPLTINQEPLTINPGQAGNNFDFEEILNPSSFPTWREECKTFLNDSYYKNGLCNDFKLPVGNVEELMRNFIYKLNLENSFKNVAALKVHFVNHYKAHKNGKQYTAFSNSKGFIEVPENTDYDNMEKW